MQTRSSVEPWWAVLTVWMVVNAVNVLQIIGFLSRLPSGNMSTNRLLGYVMIALSIPAAIALVALLRAGAGWRHWIGPFVYLVFIAFMVGVDYIWRIEFRSPVRYDVLVPYLALFFGSIVLMGAPMLRLNRRLWFVTAATAVMLLGSMGLAMSQGVG